MLAGSRHGDHEGVVLADVSGETRRMIEAFGSRFRAEALPNPEGTWFSPPNRSAGIAEHDLVQAADIINLHWVADFISTEDVVSLLSLGKPVVWTLHDAKPFTGGCHYTGGCELFKTLCIDCPQVKAAFQNIVRASHLLDINLLGNFTNLTIAAPSRWLKSEAQSSRVFSGFRAEVIPYDVNLDVFRPARTPGLRQTLGCSEDAVVVLFGGSFLSEHRKGIAILAEAIRCILKEPDISSRYEQGRLVFAAFGRGEDVLNAAGFRVHHGGVQSTETGMARLLQTADLFVCPSLEDNLPNTVMEAMACGLPVIGTNIGGIPDMVEDGVNGCLVNPGDSASLACALRRMLDETIDLKQMGRRSREICEAKFGSGTQARAYTALFEDLLAAAPPGLQAPVNSDAASRSRLDLKAAMLDCEDKLGIRSSPERRWWSKTRSLIRYTCQLLRGQ
jgi:glycosyltransferase involved in cell wall biosynthesis